MPCEVWTVGADGTALISERNALVTLDPTSGSCTPTGQFLVPSLPAPPLCYDGYEPCGAYDVEPSRDPWGCYDPGYHEECCSTARSELVAARFHPSGDLWVSWEMDLDAGAERYHDGQLVAHLPVRRL